MADGKLTEDQEKWGEIMVYCAQHLRPHWTGWCTVHVDQKTPLEAMNHDEARDECIRRGFKLYEG